MIIGKPVSEELETKIARVQALLSVRGLEALLIQKVTNFAWITCGVSSFVNTADNLGIISLLITPDGRFLIMDNIEEPRLRQEQTLESQGWTFIVSPWYEKNDTISQLTQGLRLGADNKNIGATDLSTELIHLRMNLLPQEQERFRALCQGCARAMGTTITGMKPGMTEFEIAATLSKEVHSQGILPIVNLIATDERVFMCRHPLPTNKRLKRYAMLVLCGRSHGLVASITRLVHFGPIPTELHLKAEAVAEIDAALIYATRPSRSLGEIFQTAQRKYALVGFYRSHHNHRECQKQYVKIISRPL